MNTIEQGRIGEAMAAHNFIKGGWDVYMPTFGNGKYDMIVTKDGETKTVEIKSSRTKAPSGNWQFQLRKVRSNKTKNVSTNFESDGIDFIVFCFIETGEVYTTNAAGYDGKTAVTLPSALKEK